MSRTKLLRFPVKISGYWNKNNKNRDCHVLFPCVLQPFTVLVPFPGLWLAEAALLQEQRALALLFLAEPLSP